MKLFCFPYAGGSAAIYSEWKRYLDDYIEIYPIELAGRGKRYGEEFYNSINDAVDDIYEIIKSQICTGPYAFFGHSMGSIIAYELGHKIKNMQDNQPSHIFFSGHGAPSIDRDEKVIHNLEDDEFAEEILNMGGTPSEVFENKELLQLVIPILRADFKIIELYNHNHNDQRLPCDISILNGRKDDISIEKIISWRKHSTKECKIYMFDGDHFYINTNVDNIAKVINSTLQEHNELYNNHNSISYI